MNDSVKRSHEACSVESSAFCQRPKINSSSLSVIVESSDVNCMKNRNKIRNNDSKFPIDEVWIIDDGDDNNENCEMECPILKSCDNDESSCRNSTNSFPAKLLKGNNVPSSSGSPKSFIKKSSSILSVVSTKPEIISETSNVNSSSSFVRIESCDTSHMKNRNKISNNDSRHSKSPTDEIWIIDDTEDNNESCKIEYPILKSVLEKSSENDESSYRSSTNLFPAKLLKGNNVPSASSSQNLLIGSQQKLFESASTIVKTEVFEIDESSYKSDDDEPDDIPGLNKSPGCDMPLLKLEPSKNHSIMFSPHIVPGEAPQPFPNQYKDKWDSDHIHLPCSPLNKYPVENSVGILVVGNRWDLICESLMTYIGTSEDLENAIMKYNRKYVGKWNFLGLHSFINKHLSNGEREFLFESLLPSMIEMALNLPRICTQPVPMMKKNKDHYITMSQKQIACLLLNGFFCTFPRGNPRRSIFRPDDISFPHINFNRLFRGTENGTIHRNAEKLKCLFNYFQRITTEEPTGTVTFHRQVISPRNLPKWLASTSDLSHVVIKSHGLIEHDGQGLLQVDFANKVVGEGVLDDSCVQEEIRFVVCPEFIVSHLFVESLEDNEALFIIGGEQYNKYSGYSDTFKWEGDFRDNAPRDSWGRRCTKIVAIDATRFEKYSDQFRFQRFKRDLNKAYCGFYEDSPRNHLSAIATGNWGCGAFKGSARLKFLIQLLAASECGRSLLYFTSQNERIKKKLRKMYDFLKEKNLTVGGVFKLLSDYGDKCYDPETEKQIDFYTFIYSQFIIQKTPSEQENSNLNELKDNKSAIEI